jgi:hypothetical protein
VDLILPRIGRIPQLHFCIEKKFMPKRLCCIVRYFTLASQGTHDPATIILLYRTSGVIFFHRLLHSYTVQTVDLILPRIGRIPQLHFCIEKKFMPKRLCCIVRYFTLASQGTHDPATIILQ